MKNLYRCSSNRALGRDIFPKLRLPNPDMPVFGRKDSPVNIFFQESFQCIAVRIRIILYDNQIDVQEVDQIN